MMDQRRIELSTGITLNVAFAGPEAAPPVILCHGFPESHRTWREVAPRLSDELRLIMPDLRGFGASDKPQDPADYSTDKTVGDIFALADALGIGEFALIGHDWGGASAWAAAIREAMSDAPRITRLGIVNSPHPLIFQKSLIDNAEQRAASQYMTAFRNPNVEAGIQAMGMETFFDKSFARHADLTAIPAEERQQYIDDWSQEGALTAMLNWYRAGLLTIPPDGEDAEMPPWVAMGLPKIKVPVLVVWGLDDKVLLPVQLDGIEEVGVDVDVVPLEGVGHFAPWEAGDKVAAALKPFLLAR